MYYKLGALGDDSTSTPDTSGSTTDTSWLTNLATGITQFFVGKQQLDAISQLNTINMQRAAAGLPPISSSVLAQPGVNVGLSPDVQNLLIYGGLGVGALFLINMLMKRRK